MHRVFICGSALRGQPDHGNLQSATFVKETKTLPLYRLHAAENGWHPAIYQVAQGGIAIPGEVYEMTPEQFEYLASNEPPHMYPSEVRLENDEVATAFLYPRELVEKHNWPDVSRYGSWLAYKKAVAVAQSE